MTTSSMSDIPTISTQHNDSSNIIHQATMQFIQPGCQDINALEKRAKAFAYSARPGLALRDALEIIRLAPSSSIGHALTAGIHTQYGQHARAIHHYNEALNIEHDLIRRHEIEQSSRYSEQQLSKGVDFVCKLPFELVSSFILPPTLTITSHESLLYLHVSKAWRQRALQTAYLQFTRITKSARASMYLLVSYAAYIQHISLSDHASFAFQLVFRTSFPSLQSFHIHLSTKDDIYRLYEFLKTSGKSLKVIDLEGHVCVEIGTKTHYISQTVPLCLDMILQLCPNLESFNGTVVRLSPIACTYPKVKRLMIRYMVYTPSANKSTISANTSIALVKRFPSLKQLQLPSCHDSRALPVIHQYCPSLRSLEYGTRGDATVVDHGSLTINTPGLHSLSVDESCALRLEDLTWTLTRYSNTLVNINIRGHQAYRDDSTAALDPNARFEHLRNITFDFFAEDHSTSLLRLILQHASDARSLSTIPYNVDDADIYEILTRMQHLTSIECSAPSTTMIRLMEHHGTLRHASTLRNVAVGFDHDGELHEDMLNAIRRLPQLQCLSLNLNGCVLGDRFLAFMEMLSHECPCLEELELLSWHEIPPELIPKFRLYPRLKSLTLRSPDCWDECLLDLLHCPSLVSLYLLDANLPEEAADALAKVLTYIDVTEHYQSIVRNHIE